MSELTMQTNAQKFVGAVPGAISRRSNAREFLALAGAATLVAAAQFGVPSAAQAEIRGYNEIVSGATEPTVQATASFRPDNVRTISAPNPKLTPSG